MSQLLDYGPFLWVASAPAVTVLEKHWPQNGKGSYKVAAAPTGLSLAEASCLLKPPFGAAQSPPQVSPPASWVVHEHVYLKRIVLVTWSAANSFRIRNWADTADLLPTFTLTAQQKDIPLEIEVDSGFMVEWLQSNTLAPAILVEFAIPTSSNP
jgi:hypothetical protein